MAKTVKFTYNGSRTSIKMLYLLGLGISNIGYTGYWLLAIYVIYHYFEVGDKMFHENWVNFGYGVAGALLISFIGMCIYSTAQFLNWLDRGSINSKITRNPP